MGYTVTNGIFFTTAACNIRESVLYLFTTMYDVQVSKHALTSLFTYLPRTVLFVEDKLKVTPDQSDGSSGAQ